jgi:hypothetical protein
MSLFCYAKAMQKSQKIQSERKLFWLVITALVVSVTTGIYTLWSINDIRYALKLTGPTEMQTSTDLQQLKICYQYSIHPCDRDTINQYLNQHNLDR